MFRFSIRDLILLTLAIAIALGWALDRWRLAEPLAQLAEYQRIEAQKLESARRQKEALESLIRELAEPGLDTASGSRGDQPSSNTSSVLAEDGSITIEIVDH